MRNAILLIVIAVSVAGCAAGGPGAPLSDLLEAEARKTLQLDQAPPAAGAEAGVPLIGQMSDADERSLGREIAGRLLGAYPLVQNEALQRYVNRVGRYVAGQSQRPNLPWTFGVIRNDEINAFAAPGGYVFVTAGLYRMLRNEAELAGVLAHEIAHVNERHHVKLLQQARLLALGQEFLASRTRSDSVKAVAGTGLEVYARSLDKEAEFACDRLAVEYAARGGYDPFAYVAVLDRIGAAEQPDRMALLFKTHPHPADRIEALALSIGSRWDSLGGVADTRRWVKIGGTK